MTTGKPIKILLVGARYTGKGQVGRSWGNTDADLPTLQPVILYDREVNAGDHQHRVVAWVLSFDPEFEDIRQCFYKDADAIIFTVNPNPPHDSSIDMLDEYIQELCHLLDSVPPAILMVVELLQGQEITKKFKEKKEKWVKDHGSMPSFHVKYWKPGEFSLVVEKAFYTLLKLVDRF